MSVHGDEEETGSASVGGEQEMGIAPSCVPLRVAGADRIQLTTAAAAPTCLPLV